jgi:hypothetical protein
MFKDVLCDCLDKVLLGYSFALGNEVHYHTSEVISSLFFLNDNHHFFLLFLIDLSTT